MIYNGCKINAMVEKYDLYELNDDGTLGGYLGDGGGDTDFPRYDVWTLDDGDEDENLSDFDTLEEAKNQIDEHIKAQGVRND